MTDAPVNQAAIDGQAQIDALTPYFLGAFAILAVVIVILAFLAALSSEGGPLHRS
jgi:hypothetical protein